MYFGWIFSMDTSEINERLQFLLNFLDLPSENRLVKNLRSAHLCVFVCVCVCVCVCVILRKVVHCNVMLRHKFNWNTRLQPVS